MTVQLVFQREGLGVLFVLLLLLLVSVVVPVLGKLTLLLLRSRDVLEINSPNSGGVIGRAGC
jgi:hypothetical protein